MKGCSLCFKVFMMGKEVLIYTGILIDSYYKGKIRLGKFGHLKRHLFFICSDCATKYIKARKLITYIYYPLIVLLIIGILYIFNSKDYTTDWVTNGLTCELFLFIVLFNIRKFILDKEVNDLKNKAIEKRKEQEPLEFRSIKAFTELEVGKSENIIYL